MLTRNHFHCFAGQFKSIATIGIGLFVLGGVKPTVLSVIGWIINTSGSLSYSYLRYKEKHSNSNRAHRDDNANGDTNDITISIQQANNLHGKGYTRLDANTQLPFGMESRQNNRVHLNHKGVENV